jgi:hypothetical protein
MLKRERERKLAEIRRILNNAYPLDYRASAAHAVKLPATHHQAETLSDRRMGEPASRTR